jgi:hypothetical protein
MSKRLKTEIPHTSKSRERMVPKIEKTIHTQSSSKHAESMKPGDDKAFTIKVEYASTLGPTSSGKDLVVKWVDYSSKYGIGAKLSNGTYVVLFNDSTKLVLHENNFNFVYIRRESSQSKETLDSLCQHYSFGEYPSELKKKVILI